MPRPTTLDRLHDAVPRQTPAERRLAAHRRRN
jgi:hypothetical protein